MQVNGRLLEVMAFETLLDGSSGPARCTGDMLLPGDLVSKVGPSDDLATILDTSGQLSRQVLLTFVLPIKVTFTRPEGEGHKPRDLGGRPAERQAKYASRKAAVHEAVGGAPARRGTKPQRAQSHSRPQKRKAAQPSSSSASALSVGDLLEQLLETSGLSAAQRSLRDAELEEAIYIP